MNLKVLFLILAMLVSSLAWAQTGGHSVTSTWIAPTDVNSTTTYSLYRANTSCGPTPPPPNMTKVASGITVLTYTDPEPIGTYCYYVTAVTNGVESGPSNTSEATIRPNAPSGLVTTAK